jgi:hypothetical protein
LQKEESLHAFTDKKTETSSINVVPATVVVEEQLLEKPDKKSSPTRKEQDLEHFVVKPKNKRSIFWKAVLFLLAVLGLFTGAALLWQGFLSERFSVAPIPEEKKSAMNISGEWRGFVEEIGGEHRHYEIIFGFEQQPESDEIGCHLEVFVEPEVLEGRGCGGEFNGREIRIADEKDQTYWGILEGEHFMGETAWGCFDCEPWGVFELWR